MNRTATGDMPFAAATAAARFRHVCAQPADDGLIRRVAEPRPGQATELHDKPAPDSG